MSRRGLLLALAAVLGTGAAALAHVRLHNPGTGAELFWESPENVSIVIGATGSEDVPDGSHLTALKNAIDVWNEVDGTSIALVEDPSSEARSRTDWEADDLHLIWFDEDNSSGFFPPGSGTVAVTPVWFFSSGKISDADVLFNGSGFEFTTSKEAGRFDIQDVATHELGHLLGFDHSGWAGATMYPYVDPTILLHRSLALDEIHGLRAIYPTAPSASLTGVVIRDDDSGRIRGAHVVARDASGRTAGGTLSAGDGTFALTGLPPGTYSVYATPLDEPVSSLNLTAGHSIDVDFASSVQAGTFTLDDGQSLSVGELRVGPDIALNLGRNVDRYPRRVIAGLTNLILIRGSGLTFGSTLEASSPDVTVFPVDWVGFQVSFQAVVAPDAAPGHVDLTVTSPSGDIAILPAGLEITPPSPTVTSIEPAVASLAGGTEVSVRGTGFRSGLRVVIGMEIYLEGEPGGCSLVDETQLTLTARAAPLGDYDVVVIDGSGVEGRMASALTVDRVPIIDDVFPSGGGAVGGTRVTIAGAEFDAGVSVSIGGVVQSSAIFVDAGTIELTTEPAPAGAPQPVVVTNSNGRSATRPAAFAYSGLPDPVLSAVEPAEAVELGGDTLTLRGAELRPASEVLFGVDPITGLGGTPAADVTYVDDETLLVVTPAFEPGSTTVTVRDADTGQAGVLDGSFAFTPAPAPSGGGGGCALVASTPEAFTWRGVFNGGAWMLALVALVLARRRWSLSAAATPAATAPTCPSAPRER